jgi:hypothetical protein
LKVAAALVAGLVSTVAGTLLTETAISAPAPATTVVEVVRPARPDKGALIVLKGITDAYLLAPIMAEVREQDKCKEFAGLALDVGWQPTDIPQLLAIMFRESRCIPEACSIPDRPELRRCRDWGLMQINDYSWKSTVRGLGWEMEDMWTPADNLAFSLWLFNYSEERNGCGWQPWSKRCNTP